ncbi:aminotransferase class V-fold PLP-dependent enzyme, partial [Brachyspira hyodysenteriae]|uniref:aminotransferase class V-fold PLP-dependent enzyme n=1 Tax=Brachyspira hyodysenteriae TaxID=159 RepID=UPI001177672D
MKIYPEVLEAMLPYFKDQYFNPSSMYTPAGAVHKEMEKAREQVADFLGCDPIE